MAESESPSFLAIVSYLFGWIYTICWSASFYPQPLLNYRRRSTRGATIDFPAINVLGFVAYFISNAAFLYSPVIRSQYALRHHGLVPTVRFNDLAFAGHAVLISIVILTQYSKRIWGFEKGRLAERKVSKAIFGILIGSVLVTALVALIVASSKDENPATGWAWIDVVYTFSYVKLLITFVKYIPQVYNNYRNQSTKGWSIAQILFDFTGGILSVAQLGIDSYIQGDWSGITGNTPKLVLGNVSIFFDVIFIVQHYIVYPKKDRKEVIDEDDPLLGHDRSD